MEEIITCMDNRKKDLTDRETRYSEVSRCTVYNTGITLGARGSIVG
jgi:hypothetical protein